MIGNFFAAVFDVIAGIGEGIMSLFATVADAVVGLAIVPFASLFGALANWGVNALCELMELLGVSTYGLFRIDIGTGKSMFEIVVGGIGWLTPIMRLGGMCLVFFIFISALAKIMVSPDGSRETPGSLIGATLASGILVYAIPTILKAFERLFNEFLSATLTTVAPGDLNFSGFASAAQTFVQGGSLEVSIGAQVASVVTCIVFLILILTVAISFLRFFKEVAERYVILAFLFLTAPLAVSFLTSVNTRRSFGAWVRMVASTMVLMVTNAFFLGVFFRALGSFSSTLDALQAAGVTNTAAPMIVVFVWCFVMAALLSIAGKMDSYLQTLGVSTAECGASMMTMMIGQLFLMGALKHYGRRGRGGWQPRAGKRPGVSGPTGPSNGPDGEILDQRMGRQKAQAQVKEVAELDRSGSVTPQSLSKVVALSMKGAEATGAAYGRAVLKGMSGMPSKLTDQLDPSTCTIKDGSIRMSTFPDSAGQRTTFTMSPAAYSTPAGAESMGVQGGRVVRLDGYSYRAFAIGPDATKLNAYNPGTRAELASRYPDAKVSHVKVDGVGTGVYRMTEDRPDGSRVLREWAPASAYHPDAGLNATVENIRGMNYYTYEVPFAADKGIGTGYICYCEAPIVPTEPADRAEWLSHNFPQAADRGYTVTGGSGSVITLEREGEFYTMAPVVMYEVKDEMSRNVEIFTASNGTKYAAVKGTVDEAFTARSSSSGSFSEAIDFASQGAQTAGKAVPELFKAAIQHKGKGERRN